jgi:hypothetical protein
MQKLGMTYSPGEDFEHFMFEDGHRNRRHVVYRITAELFRRVQAA